MAIDPSPDLELTPINGKPRSLRMWLTTFHLMFVALDPYTNESAWILPTATRILTHFEQADCRVAILITADAADAREFLGPWADEILTFVDPERTAIKGFGFERLPAIAHLDMGGSLVHSAEGWNPPEWRKVTDHVAQITRWSAPVFPLQKDPGPFPGSPALG